MKKKMHYLESNKTIRYGLQKGLRQGPGTDKFRRKRAFLNAPPASTPPLTGVLSRIKSGLLTSLFVYLRLFNSSHFEAASGAIRIGLGGGSGSPGMRPGFFKSAGFLPTTVP